MPSEHDPNPPGPARLREGAPWAAVAASVALVALLIGLNLQKSLWVGIQGWGRPYWWLDYHHGFVRRGLAGEIFQALFGRLSETQLIVPVGWEHRVCLTILAVALLVQLALTLRAQAHTRCFALILAVAAWAAASQFWSTLAYNQGYLDSLVLALAAVAALLMRSRQYWAVGLCLAVGPFVHEYFCFLVPFILACDRIADPALEAGPQAAVVGLDEEELQRSGMPPRLLWLTAVAVAAAAIVMLLPAAAAARLEIDAMPLGAEDRTILVKTTLTQTLQQSLVTCLGLIFDNLGFVLKNALFFAGPALLATGALLFWTRRRPSLGVWLRVAAGLFPLGALAIAWDLSRLLVMADFTAAMLFLALAHDLPAPASESGARRFGLAETAGAGAAIAAAMAYLILPTTYVYYPPGPATLFPATSRFGLAPHTFGLQRLWATSQISALSESLPPDQKRPGPQLLHDLQPIAGVSRAGLLGWRIAARPTSALVLFGPYIDLKPGRYRIDARLKGSSGAGCTTPEVRIDASSKSAGKPVASAARVKASGACTWSVEADMDVPAGGSTSVETLIFLKDPEALLLDRYAVEPASAHSR